MVDLEHQKNSPHKLEYRFQSVPILHLARVRIIASYMQSQTMGKNETIPKNAIVFCLDTIVDILLKLKLILKFNPSSIEQ